MSYLIELPTLTLRDVRADEAKQLATAIDDQSLIEISKLFGIPREKYELLLTQNEEQRGRMMRDEVHRKTLPGDVR